MVDPSSVAEYVAEGSHQRGLPARPSRVGVIDFTGDGACLPDAVTGVVAWQATAVDFNRSLRKAPVDKVVLHVRLGDSSALADVLDRVKDLKPEVSLLLAASSSSLLVIAEIKSIAQAPAVKRDGVLSARELQVLTAIRTGRTNREIAHALGISPCTVNRHVENILRKLPARNRAQAAAARTAVPGYLLEGPTRSADIA
jgi:DNA-binding CsgD family transcriptional regulator